MGVLTGIIRVIKAGIFSDLINFLRFKELRAYWVDTSGNDLINDVLKQITK